MGTIFFIDYLVSFFILLAIDAPWRAWLVYAGSALFWFVVWALCGDGANQETSEHKTKDYEKQANLFKKHKEKGQQEDTAMFHCSNCGNDFEAKRYITRETFDDDSMTITTIYFPMKCPNCGEWATTQKTIQQYKVSCTEA